MKKITEWLRQFQETGEADMEFEIHYGHIIAVAILAGLLIYQCNR